MTMVLEPTILMFDGPTPGMSVNEVPAALDLIARLKTDKTKTIHLVEHRWASCARSPIASPS
jgi:branched-chain amino acid transport system ATP-binding protein